MPYGLGTACLYNTSDKSIEKGKKSEKAEEKNAGHMQAYKGA